MAMSFETRQLSAAPDVIAPDGSEVRILSRGVAGSLAHFTLPPSAVAKAVAHRTVEEIWYVVSGHGRVWRRLDTREAVTTVTAGTSLTIPVGTHFQFRCDGDAPLTVLGVTMPPWPGEAEADAVAGPWAPTV